jgi:hypothetical protein
MSNIRYDQSYLPDQDMRTVVILRGTAEETHTVCCYGMVLCLCVGTCTLWYLALGLTDYLA